MSPDLSPGAKAVIERLTALNDERADEIARLTRELAEDAPARAVARIAELEGDRDRVQKGLLDPHTVHINMLRGTIAWIGWRRACHITGDVPNGEDYQLSEIVRLRAEVEALRAERDALAEPCSRLVAMDFGADGWCAQCEAQAKGIRDALRAIAARKGEGSEPPANCRQRLAAEGKAYPRSRCEACGQFAPLRPECDALLEAKRAAQHNNNKEPTPE